MVPTEESSSKIKRLTFLMFLNNHQDQTFLTLLCLPSKAHQRGVETGHLDGRILWLGVTTKSAPNKEQPFMANDSCGLFNRL